ncbi:MAG: hypothetical protein WCG26_12925, partial [Chloroflexales bacterium]
MALLGDVLLRFRADTSDLDRGFASAERQAQQFAARTNTRIPVGADTSRMAGDLQGGDGAVQSWGSRIGAMLKDQFAKALPFSLSGMIDKTLGNAYNAVRGSVFGMNTQLEDTTLQFTTLMGDADAAKQHVKDLFVFAKDTPFETGPVIQASRLLRTFGGAALDTKEELTRLGNATAVSGSDIGNVAFWYSRLYSSIKSGTPFGEASARLGELGIMSGTLRQKMEGMQKAGVDGKLIWAEWQKAMDQNGGAMLRMAGTMTGLKSTISDTISISGAMIFKPLFDGYKEVLMLIATALSSGPFNNALQGMTDGFAAAFGGVQTIIEGLLPIIAGVWGVFQPLISVAWDWGSGFVKAFAGGIGSAFNWVWDALSGLAGGITDLLMPHSPPKILPNLDKWGTKTAEVWMSGWKEADFTLFEQIGKSVSQALENAVGAGKIKEVDQIPMLAKAKSAIAEMMQAWQADGAAGNIATDASYFDKIKAAVGPASQSVYDMVLAYMRLDTASREVKATQEELTVVTDRYSAILNPLNAQLSGVERQMALVRDQQRLTEINKNLPGA